MYGINLSAIDHYFVVQVRSSRKACVTNITDELSALNHLTLTNNKGMHVRVSGAVAEPVVYFDHLPVAAEAYLSMIHFAICRSINGSTDCRRKVNSGMHLLYLVDRMYAHSEAGRQRDQFLVGNRLNRWNGCEEFLFVLS